MAFFTIVLFLGLAVAGLFGQTSSSVTRVATFVGGGGVLLYVIANIAYAIKVNFTKFAQLTKNAKSKEKEKDAPQ